MHQQITITERANGRFNNTNLESRMYVDNICYIFGEIDDETAYNIVQQLQYLEAKDPEQDITIVINSPGGSVSAGLAIFDVMCGVQNDINTVCVGKAASMGAFLLAGGTKGKRQIYPNAEVLIHQPLGGAQGQATEIEIVAEHIKKTKKTLNQILSANTGKSEKEVAKDTDRDNWMSSLEAVKYGICDEVISTKEVKKAN